MISTTKAATFLTNEATSFTLSCGLTVVLLHQPASPLLSVHLRILAGSVYEAAPLGAGLSHFLEHAMFLGSKALPQKEQFSKIIESYGGNNLNAYTTYDHTAYHFTVFKEHVEKALFYLSDFIANPLFPEAAVREEKGTILSEMDMYDDRPGYWFNLFLFSVAFAQLPYRYPIIGIRNRFKALGRESLVNYHRTFYRPERMLLSLVGDFSTSKAAVAETVNLKPLLEKLFPSSTSNSNQKGQQAVKLSSFLPHFPPERPWKKTDDAFAAHLQETTHPKARVARGAFIWQAVSFHHPHRVALELLAEVLASGEGSLLYQLLKEELNLVEGVQAYSFLPLSQGVFIITVQFPELKENFRLRQQIETVKARLFAFLEQLPSALSQEFFQGSKRAFLKALIDDKEPPTELASLMAFSMHYTNNLHFPARYFSALNALSKEEVTSCAARYLRSDNFSFALLTPPRNYEQGAIFSSAKRVTLDPLLHRGETLPAEEPALSKAPPAFFVLEEPPSAPPAEAPVFRAPPPRSSSPSGSVLQPKLSTFKNGVKLLLGVSQRLPKATLMLQAVGGLGAEQGAAKGAGALLSELCFAGNDSYSKKEFVALLREHGLDYAATSSENTFSLEFSGLSESVPVMLTVLRSILQSSGLQAADFEREKKDQLYRLKKARERGEYRAAVAFRRHFLAGTPYENPLEGSLESVAALTLSPVEALRRRSFSLSKVVVSLYGFFSLSAAEEQLQFLSALPQRKAEAEPRFFPTPYTTGLGSAVNSASQLPRCYREDYERAAQQTHFRLAFRAFPFLPLDSTQPATELRRKLLCLELLRLHLSGLGGALFQLRSMDFKVKGKSLGGRAYRLGCTQVAHRDYGSFVFYAALRREAREEAPWLEEQLGKLICRLYSKPLSVAELEEARTLFLASRAERFFKLSYLASGANTYELFGLGHEEFLRTAEVVKTITAEEVLAVAQQVFSAPALMHVVKPVKA